MWLSYQQKLPTPSERIKFSSCEQCLCVSSILYFGSQTAVGHDDQEGEFQQEPIISLVVEPYFSIRFKKPGPIKSTKSWKKTSTQQFEQFLIVYLHNPTVFYNLFKNKSKITRYLTICYTKHFQLLNENLDFWRRSQWSSLQSPKDLFGEMIQRDLIKFLKMGRKRPFDGVVN